MLHPKIFVGAILKDKRGNQVRIVCTDILTTNSYVVMGLVSQNSVYEEVCRYNDNGLSANRDRDLVLPDEYVKLTDIQEIMSKFEPYYILKSELLTMLNKLAKREL